MHLQEVSAVNVMHTSKQASKKLEQELTDAVYTAVCLSGCTCLYICMFKVFNLHPNSDQLKATDRGCSCNFT